MISIIFSDKSLENLPRNKTHVPVKNIFTFVLEKDADNSHLHRCEEIERWTKDVHDWCVRRFGKENIIGFHVHLDESSPHIHALIVPVGIRPKSGRECVMWSAKFGKNRFEYGRILREMHTSLYEEVGSKYGLERGDSIDGRNVLCICTSAIISGNLPKRRNRRRKQSRGCRL